MMPDRPFLYVFKLGLYNNRRGEVGVQTLRLPTQIFLPKLCVAHVNPDVHMDNTCGTPGRTRTFNTCILVLSLPSGLQGYMNGTRFYRYPIKISSSDGWSLHPVTLIVPAPLLTTVFKIWSRTRHQAIRGTGGHLLLRSVFISYEIDNVKDSRDGWWMN